MPKEVTIPLSVPITGHGGEVRSLTLRAPKAADYFELGPPFTYDELRDGRRIAVEVPPIIDAYVKRLITKDAELLPQVDLADAFLLEDAVMGFFGDARRRAYPTPATSSSSTSGSSPQPNAAS